MIPMKLKVFMKILSKIEDIKGVKMVSFSEWRNYGPAGSAAAGEAKRGPTWTIYKPTEARWGHRGLFLRSCGGGRI